MHHIRIARRYVKIGGIFMYKYFCDVRKSKQREYYRSKVGIWYTVWWRSQEDEKYSQYYQHWMEWSRLLPVKGRYSSGNKSKVRDDFIKFANNHIGYLILDDTNSHDNDNHSIADNIADIYNVADEMQAKGEPAPDIAVALGSRRHPYHPVIVIPDDYFEWFFKESPIR